MAEENDLAVADDRLDGAEAIATFTGDPVWKVYAKAAAGVPGIYKVGGSSAAKQFCAGAITS